MLVIGFFLGRLWVLDRGKIYVPAKQFKEMIANEEYDDDDFFEFNLKDRE